MHELFAEKLDLSSLANLSPSIFVPSATMKKSHCMQWKIKGPDINNLSYSQLEVKEVE
jgi:hypothetical protein